MKNLLYILMIGFLFACASQNKIGVDTRSITPKGPELVSDSVEYELIIIDPGFDSWFITRALESSARSEQYYKYWNHLYVIEWNELYRRGHPYFDSYIDYDPFEDYGFDLNYKLYYYFVFVEEKVGIHLLNRAYR